MGDSSFQRPGLTSLRGLGVLPRRQLVVGGGPWGGRKLATARAAGLKGRGVPPRWRSMFKEGCQGTAVPNGPVFPA